MGKGESWSVVRGRASNSNFEETDSKPCVFFPTAPMTWMGWDQFEKDPKCYEEEVVDGQCRLPPSFANLPKFRIVRI